MIERVSEAELAALAEEVGARLRSRGLVLTTAESCTGGWLSKAVTDIAGSSAWLDRGFVTYSNAAKQEMLGVRAETLEAQGAVSEAVVREMVDGALRRSGAQVAVAVSGIAGPGGGTAGKPVGTVWLAWGLAGVGVQAECRLFAGDREQVRAQSVRVALEGILDLLASYG